MSGVIAAIVAAAIASGAANRLLTAIFHAFGYDPDSHRLVTDARAREKANLITRQAEVKAIQYRRRWRQSTSHLAPADRRNLGRVLEQSFVYLNEDADATHVDRDKLRYLLEKAKIVSNDDMQSLWARILAGEVNQPGSFSKRTFDIVSSLDRQDAEDFTRICEFCCESDDGIDIYLYVPNEDYLGPAGLTFTKLTNLEDCGLIKPLSYGLGSNVVTPFSSIDRKFVKYFDIDVWFDTEQDEIALGAVGLTAQGKELTKISGAKPNSRVFTSLIDIWSSRGINPYSKIDLPPA